MTQLATNITFFISLGVIISDLSLVFFICLVIGGKRTPLAQAVFGFIARNALWLGFLVSAAGVLVSLFYSQIVGFAPCDLCWWSRIFIYPQSLIFLVAIIRRRKDKEYKSVFAESAVLSVLGLLVAAYQYYGSTFDPGVLSCSASAVSCSKIYFTAFGYVTLPMMALTGFMLLLAIVVARKLSR
jgi:disulfide bond formation protein DsbB